jgi:general secretion pathway protein G
VKEVPKDPWGSEFQYRCPGVHNQNEFDLWSRGGDRTDGGMDKGADIQNWTEDRQ